MSEDYLWSQYLFPLAEYDDGIYLYFLQLCILYKYWYFIPLFTKETYLSVADSLFIINYEMMKINKASGNFLPRMHGNCQVGVVSFGKFSFCRSSVSTCTKHGLWYDHDVVLDDIAPAKFNKNKLPKNLHSEHQDFIWVWSPWTGSQSYLKCVFKFLNWDPIMVWPAWLFWKTYYTYYVVVLFLSLTQHALMKWISPPGRCSSF